MNTLAKYFFLAAGVFSAAVGCFNDNIAAGIASVGLLLSFVWMEATEYKLKK